MGEKKDYVSKKRKLQAEHCEAMREKKCRLSVTINTELIEASSSPKRPVLRSSLPYKKVQNIDGTYAVNIEILTESIQKCQYCDVGPLNLANICMDVTPKGPIPILNVKCHHCDNIKTLRPGESHRTGKRGPEALDVNSRSGLGALHTGIDHTHYSGLLSTLGLPSLTFRNYKKREREAGVAIESVAKRSCSWYTEKEKELSSKIIEEEEVVEVGVSYDMGWRKRGKSYDLSSGVGTVVGLKTGKVVNYATRNTMCRVCKEASNNNKEPAPHDCRQNHQGSSKSMESNVAVELFSGAVEQGVSYATYVGDDDSTTESIEGISCIRRGKVEQYKSRQPYFGFSVIRCQVKSQRSQPNHNLLFSTVLYLQHKSKQRPTIFPIRSIFSHSAARFRRTRPLQKLVQIQRGPYQLSA